MEAGAEAKERSGELSMMISAATEGHFRPYRSTASVVLNAMGGDPVVAVVADKRVLETDGDGGIKGTIAVFTATHVGFVTFTRAASGNSHLASDDEPTSVEVVARHAVTSVVMHSPAIRRRRADEGTFRWEELPWGTELHVQYAGREEPLVIRDDISSMPMAALHKSLLADLTAGR